MRRGARRVTGYGAVVLVLATRLAFAGPLTVTDAEGHTVTLAAPAQRVVSLAPHATEMLFAIGAGDRVVGAAQYSDYPEAAKRIPRVGGATSLDIERLRALRPDLVVAWSSKALHRQLGTLRAFGIAVFVTDARTISEVATTIETLGELTGTFEQAQKTAQGLRDHLDGLRSVYSHRPVVRMFYQIWNRPLMTVGRNQVITEVMRICGAANVFGNLAATAPIVDVEAVLVANPELIVSSGPPDERREWLSEWEKWPGLEAVEKRNLYLLPPDLLTRMGPRIGLGAQELCEVVDTARRKRG